VLGLPPERFSKKPLAPLSLSRAIEDRFHVFPTITIVFFSLTDFVAKCRLPPSYRERQHDNFVAFGALPRVYTRAAVGPQQ
jgi:hypothetical protein